ALAIQVLVAGARSARGEEPCPEVRMAVPLGAVQIDAQADNPMDSLMAVGDTLSSPIQLLGHAASGELLVSPQIGRLVEGQFALLAREVPSGAGQANPVGAYSVVGLTRGSFPTGGRGGLPPRPVVGRDRELATLHQLLDQVERGQGQVVGIVGEPGMGKSRLLYEFRRNLAGKRVTYLEGRCLSYASAIPYTPVLDVLREHCGIAGA